MREVEIELPLLKNLRLSEKPFLGPHLVAMLCYVSRNWENKRVEGIELHHCRKRGVVRRC